MRYAVVYADFIRRAPYAVASLSAQHAWHHLNVSAYEEENGGLIANCRHFDDRAWMAKAGLTVAQVDDARAAKLAIRRGNGLLIAGYNIDRENAYKTNRANGQKGGRRPKSAKNKAITKNPGDNPPDNPGDNPRGNPSALLRSAPLRSDLPSLEKNGREGGSGIARPPVLLAPLGDGTGAGPEATTAPDHELLEQALQAIRRGHELSLKDYGKLPAPMPTPFDPDEVKEHASQLVDWAESHGLEYVKEAANVFFRRDGKRHGDTFWRDRNWDLHTFVTQGLRECQGEALKLQRRRNGTMNGRVSP